MFLVPLWMTLCRNSAGSVSGPEYADEPHAPILRTFTAWRYVTMCDADATQERQERLSRRNHSQRPAFASGKFRNAEYLDLTSVIGNRRHDDPRSRFLHDSTDVLLQSARLKKRPIRHTQ